MDQAVSYKTHSFSDRIFFLLVDTWSDWFDRVEHLLPDPEKVNPQFHCVEADGQFFVFSLDGAIAGVGATQDDAARDGVSKLLFRMGMGAYQEGVIDLTLN